MANNDHRAKLTPEQRAEISRQNGAKSKGPATPGGRERSSRNAITHGVYTGHVVLENESEEVYLSYRQGYLDTWQPVGPVEEDLVMDIVNARWRLSRVLLMETAGIACNLERQRKAVTEEFEYASQPVRLHLAYTGYNGDPGRGVHRLDRAEARLLRVITRSTQMLERLQDQRRKTAAASAEAPDAGTPLPSGGTSQLVGPGTESGPEHHPGHTSPADQPRTPASGAEPGQQTKKCQNEPAACTIRRRHDGRRNRNRRSGARAAEAILRVPRLPRRSRLCLRT